MPLRDVPFLTAFVNEVNVGGYAHWRDRGALPLPVVGEGETIALWADIGAETIFQVNLHTDQRASAINQHVDAKTNEVNTKLTAALTDARDKILAAISGGAGDTDAIVNALNHLGNVLGADEDRLDQVLKSSLEAIHLAINGVAGAGRGPADAIRGELTKAVGQLQVQLAQLGIVDGEGTVSGSLDATRMSLGELTDEFTRLGKDFFTVHPEAEDLFQQAGVPDLRRLWAVLPKIVGGLIAGGVVANQLTDGKLGRTLLENFPFMAELIPDLARGLGEKLVHGIEATHVPLRAVMGGLADLFFQNIDGELAQLGQADPETVLPMARQLLTLAASLGATSHLMSVAAEKATSVKHLGIPFVSAFLTDLAGFENIARNSFGVQYETALREPAQRRARARFRPSLPPAMIVEQMWYERRISDEDLRRYYAQQGWSDSWIESQLATLPIEANPRDLALVFEDGDVDLAWATQHLVRRGFTDEDAARIAGGVRARALRTARSSAVTAVMNAYEQGLLDASGVSDRLRPLRLSDEAIELYLLGSDLDRFRSERTQLRTELLAEVSTGVIAPEDVEATLAAWGYDQRAQRHTAALARLRANRRIFTEEKADTKAATRRAQAAAISAAQDAFRRGLLNAEGLAAELRQAGVTDAEVAALVDLAVIRNLPVPRLAAVLSPEAQAQRLLDFEIDRVTTLVRRGVIDAAIGLASLVGLGVDRAEAERRVQLAAAQAAKPPDRFTPRTINEVVEEARRVKLATAREEFRAGLLTLNGLGQALADAGIEPPVIAAVVEFEEAKRRADADRKRQTDADRFALEIRREQQDKAVAAFRAGQIDEPGLLENLRAIGVADALAEAIVESEALRRDQEEQAAGETAAERELTADQRLREEAVIFGLRNGLVDDDQARQLLVDAGVSETRAALLIAREQARRKQPAA